MTAAGTPPGPPAGGSEWGPHNSPPQGSPQAPPPGAPPGPPPAPGAPHGFPPGPPPAGPPAQPGWGAPAGPPAGWGPPPPWGSGSTPWGKPQAPKPGVVPLRPLGFGELLDGAFTTVQRYPKIMLGMSTAIMAVVGVASVAAFFLGFGDLMAMGDDELLDVSDSVWIQVGASMFGLMLATWIASMVLTGMITATVARGVLGRPITVGEAWTTARTHLLRLLGLTLVLGFGWTIAIGVLVGIVVAATFIHVALAVLLGIVVTLGGIFAMVVVGTRLAVAAAALVLESRPAHPGMPDGHQEKLGVFASIVRSWNLIKGRTFRTFGVLFVANLVVSVIASILQTALMFAGSGAAVGFGEESTTGIIVAGLLFGIGYLASMVLQVAFLSAVTVLVYVDARMRSEGLDIELAQAAATTTGAASPWATA
ncbi:hypothetical protein ABN028_28400 [Actinopolymorpha sp. B17G11]|uniref:hypothetical protein n=1 Tax=Actinopolymorpha sp. B17G11 TaxID=3160861 RepID=UPI0032E4BB23